MHTENAIAAPIVARAPLRRVAINGPTMGTRYAAILYAPPDADLDAVGRALAASVTEVDQQMSTWKPDSDLMRLNAAPVGSWVALPARLLSVLAAGLEIGRASGGAFDIGVLDLTTAWGFQSRDHVPDAADLERLASTPRRPAHEIVELDLQNGGAIKHAPVGIDLSGIAKGYGADRLAETLHSFDIVHFLVSIDGEVRASGGKPGGTPWRVAVEQPNRTQRDVAGFVELTEGALATSGTYRHRAELGDTSHSHTMNPRTGRPVANDMLSATAQAPTCMEADAWATVAMVRGEAEARPLLRRHGVALLSICQAE